MLKLLHTLDLSLQFLNLEKVSIFIAVHVN